MFTKIKVFDDEKEHVKKVIFEKNDIAIESVLYRYPTYEERTVLCISVMCGCPMGCRFCGTGDHFVRSLSANEIVFQATHILENMIDGLNPNEIKKLQIMVMSMGEPVLVNALWEAFRILHKEYPHAALLVSTSAPKVDYTWINQMSVEIPTVGLQFSIHESTDEARNKLIPFKNKMTLKEISDQGFIWYLVTGRKPFFNYCAHKNNTSDEDIQRLLELFNPVIWEATISVICEREMFMDVRNDVQRNLAVDFGDKLVYAGYNVRVFDPAGQDTIGGGCGQLWYTQEWMKNNQEKIRCSVGYNLEKVHTPN